MSSSSCGSGGSSGGGGGGTSIQELHGEPLRAILGRVCRDEGIVAGLQRCRAVCREWERAACGLVEFVSLIAARPGHGQPWGRSGRSGGAGAGSGGREDDIDDDDNDDWDACAADSVLQELRRYPSVKRVRVGAAAEIRAASYVRVLTRLACADPAEELVALTSLDLVYWHHHPGPGCCALGSGVGSGVGSGLGSESGSGAEAWSPGSRGSAWGSVLGGWGGVSREAWEEPGEVHLGEVQSPLQALDALLTRRQGTLVKLSLTLVNPEEFACAGATAGGAASAAALAAAAGGRPPWGLRQLAREAVSGAASSGDASGSSSSGSGRGSGGGSSDSGSGSPSDRAEREGREGEEGLLPEGQQEGPPGFALPSSLSGSGSSGNNNGSGSGSACSGGGGGSRDSRGAHAALPPECASMAPLVLRPGGSGLGLGLHAQQQQQHSSNVRDVMRSMRAHLNRPPPNSSSSSSSLLPSPPLPSPPLSPSLAPPPPQSRPSLTSPLSSDRPLPLPLPRPQLLPEAQPPTGEAFLRIVAAGVMQGSPPLPNRMLTSPLSSSAPLPSTSAPPPPLPPVPLAPPPTDESVLDLGRLRRLRTLQLDYGCLPLCAPGGGGRCGRPLPSYRTFFRLGALAELRALSIRSPVESPLPDSLWVLSGLQHLRLTVEESSGSSNSSRNQGFGFGRPRLLVPRRRPLHASNPNPSTNFDPCNLNTTGTLLPTRQRGLYPNYNPSPNPNAIGIQSLNPLLRFNPDPDPGRNTNPNPNPMPEWPLLPQAPHVDLGPLDRPFENLKGLREVELRMLDIRSGLSEGEATALLSIPTLTALSVHALRQRCSRNSALRGHGPPAHAHAHAQAHPHHLRQRNNDGNVGAVGRAHVNARAGANASSVRAREHAHARALQALLYWPGLSRLSLDLFELPPMPSGHLMPRLRELTLVVHLSTFEHDFFRHLPNLTHLDVTLYNVFVWPTLGNLLHLTSLRIGFLNPSSKLPGGFSPPALKKLELADCTMRSRLPEILGHQNLSDEVAVSLSCPCKRCIDAGIFIV